MPDEPDVLRVVGLENKSHTPPEAPSAPPPQGGATSGPAKPVPRWPANVVRSACCTGVLILFF
ncbi:MAG: hypothetical protein CVU30_00835 [Betaproteobacteria bacterium HGW-Betaproteobacteria-3]|nr:MAG: hypothetical protein CVU30_00835 [Betaproteobacteria bacterium HGW-Betaproteobacteria-3]